MSEVTIREAPLTADDYLALRRAVNWPVPEEAAVVRALEGTLHSVVAEEDGQVIGMARVVGDGSLCFFVQDVIVHPEFQRQGCGTRLMDAVMEYINRRAGSKAYIGLFSARGLESFYARYGFVERPNKSDGPGMVYIKP